MTSKDSPKHGTKPVMTPLWVISLFLSLTEVITGIAVIKATAGVQMALTVFVIVFPTFVASAFFLILWHKPYVFYPPTEFAGDVSVADYVRAMGARPDPVTVDKEDLDSRGANVVYGAGQPTWQSLSGEAKMLIKTFDFYQKKHSGLHGSSRWLFTSPYGQPGHVPFMIGALEAHRLGLISFDLVHAMFGLTDEGVAFLEEYAVEVAGYANRFHFPD